jgi:hypothetical protein
MKRADLLAAFRTKGFQQYNATSTTPSPIPDLWDTWLPKAEKNLGVGKRPIDYTVSLGRTIEKFKTLGGMAEFRHSTPKINVKIDNPPASVKTKAGFKTALAARPDYQSGWGPTGFPVYEQYGHATFDAFFDSFTWTPPKKLDSDPFIWVGTRHEYNVLLPGDGLVIDVALLVGLSSKQGIYFGGSGGLEISLPAHIQLGPIEIVSATLAIKPKDGVIPLEAGATIKGELGPLKAVVENVGMRVELSFPADRDGNLGTANLGLGFKPPSGVGLSIDAGVVKGGGYLFIDVDRGEYAGALELTIANYLSLKAIGLISTKNPDGSPGFSLLVIITAEFGSGLQLGYGFVLIGVGGLLGLNRTMRFEPLMLGVRTGAINRIMFPTDIVANAPRIISDLRTIFSPQQGTFLIGPMLKLGWGAGLISIAVGVIIEIPGNVAIIGVLKVALPTPDEPVAIIQANFAGAIEFDKKRGCFFAALFESRVLTMTLEGEMGCSLRSATTRTSS